MSRRGGFHLPVRLLLLYAALALVACRSEPEPAPRFDDPEYDGLSREEIERQAEPMTPAEAERLGIVDTTIRIEAPINPDSLIELQGREVLPVDTTLRR
jgi:hypothetical protein